MDPLVHRAQDADQLLSVTMKDIADRVGVSVATVSRALSGKPSVREGTRAAVLAAAEGMGYHLNLVARSLRTSRTFVVGALIPDIGNPFYAEMLRGLEDATLTGSYSVMTASSAEDPVREACMLRALVSRGVDGVVLAVADSRQSRIDALRDAGVPFVLVDRLLYGVDADSVTVDNESGAATAVSYMAARGYRRIGIVVGPQNLSNAVGRLTGYQTALARLGLESDGLVFQGDFRESSGARIGRQILQMEHPPEALLVCNNLMTLGLYKTISAAGWRMPHDIAVAGFDDSAWASLAIPPVTVIDQSPYDMGRQAAELLLDRVSNGSAAESRSTVLPTQLIRRGTC